MSSTECPRCGYNPPPTSNNPIRSHQEGLLALQAELQCIENSIARLTYAKFAVLRKLNNTRPAMRNLPPEVLATIFQFARPPIDIDKQCRDLKHRSNTFHTQERFLYVLAAVSHGWRQVAVSTPRLWTNVRLKIDLDSGTLSADRNFALLDLHIQRSRNIPMSIELIFEDLRDKEILTDEIDDEERRDQAIWLRERCLELWEPLREVIFVDQASRIQDLILIRPLYEWFQFVNKTLSQCGSVMVYQPQPPILDDVDALDLRNFPCLQRIQLIDWRHSDFLIPSSVSILYLRKLPLEDCLELLLSCRNLVKFDIIDFKDRADQPQVNKPVVFPNLEHFGWSWGSSKGALAVLRYIRLPSLRSLVWSDDDYGQGDDPDYQDLCRLFFSRLPPTLSSLTLRSMYTYSEKCTIKPLLNSVPQVSELHFTDCSHTTVHTVINVIGQPYSTTKSKNSSAIVLPNLRKMSIIASGPRDKPLNLRNFVAMLKGLHKVVEGRKHFQLIIEKGGFWKEDDGELGKLRELVNEGFDLEVIVHQRPR